MKILTLSNLYPPHYVGGYELYCQTMLDALRRRGHDIEVLTSDYRVRPGVAQPVETGVSRSLRIHGLLGHPFVGIQQLHHIEFHNNRTLISTCRRVKPDLVYVWAFAGLSKSMLLTLQRMNVPVVFSVCDHWIARSGPSDVWLNWWNRHDARVQQKLLRALWTFKGHRARCQRVAPTNPVSHLQFQRIYFCSRALRDSTAMAGFNVSHGRVIHCSVDTERFDGRPKSSADPMTRLLYVGRLHPDKGVMTAVRALSLLRDKFAGELTICGGGDAAYENKLRSFVKAERLPVKFLSQVPPECMPEIYRSHDALLFTSEWPEPFAIAPLEAMACGLPVIATLTGGSRELFRHRENALTYAAGDATELAQSIVELDKNPCLRERIARHGHREVREKFARENIVDEVETYLKESVHDWRPVSLPAFDHE
jgi:glycogen synthase